MLSSNDKKGIFLCILSTACIVLQDVLSKKLLEFFPVGQIILVRHIVFVLFAVWWLARRGGGIAAFGRAFRRSSNIPIQLLRCSLMVMEIFVFFWALRYVGVAEAHAVFMLFPILTALLAALLLREQLTRRKLVALALGFAGAMLIIRPGGDAFNPALLVTLGAAFLFALYNVTTRHVAGRDSFDVSMVYMATVALLWSAPPGLLGWNSEAPPLLWWLLALATVVGIVVHLLIVKSLEYASASLLQPYNYTLVGWALLFSWVFYGEVLDMLSIAGIVIVLAGGLYMLGGKTPAVKKSGKMLTDKGRPG